MSSKKVFYVMIAGLGLLVIMVVLATYGATVFLQRQGDKLSGVKVENRVVEEQHNFLIQAKGDLEKYDELGQITESIVPQDKDQAKTVRELTAIANKSGIKLGSIIFQSSTLGSKPAQAPTPGGSSPTELPPTSPPSDLTQVSPVPGIPGVYALEIIISPETPASYYQFLSFLENLESNPAHCSRQGNRPEPDY